MLNRFLTLLFLFAGPMLLASEPNDWELIAQKLAAKTPPDAPEAKINNPFRVAPKLKQKRNLKQKIKLSAKIIGGIIGGGLAAVGGLVIIGLITIIACAFSSHHTLGDDDYDAQDPHHNRPPGAGDYDFDPRPTPDALTTQIGVPLTQEAVAALNAHNSAFVRQQRQTVSSRRVAPTVIPRREPQRYSYTHADGAFRA